VDVVEIVAEKEEFDKAAEGWFFDARDRRGVLNSSRRFSLRLTRPFGWL
jgi:hypothetical protein